MEQLKTNSQTEVITKLNELYIMTRKKYLIQFPEQYVTLNKDRQPNVFYLNDSLLKKHLEGNCAYGVFAGGYFTKFITFDVDSNDITVSRWATGKLVMILTEEYGINRKDLHVSLSGSKGYHVDIFFSSPVSVNDLLKFYYAVIQDVGAIPKGQIEFRPSWHQGVKLPLGVHQRTGNRCWFVDNWTLEPIESYDYILNIKPIEPAVITDQYFDISDEQAEEFNSVVEETDITVNKADFEKGFSNAIKILDAGQLLSSNSRHNATFNLARFFLSQGYEEDEAETKILTVLHNTPRDYFSADSTPEHWQKEAHRLVGLVYQKQYTFGNQTQEIEVSKSEILAILSAGTFRTKQLLYAMLVTSKRYGNPFYLTESTGMKMIGTSSKETFSNALKRLINSELLEYTRKGEIDKARSRQEGRPHYKPNMYRLLIAEPVENEPKVNVTDNDTLVDVATKLLNTSEIRRYVKRKEYNNRWKR
ncbi:hypothetical protein K8O68_09430 [Salipaludibacillus sp. CUR1]|uniref:TOTE conflict system archaeo-eukaryotic primase domain-containing protein n=1 Tax=Salipaludibacillus sp. CUR1 TaxID=2820003 RepID=UPI001E51F2A0|nr:hypothetical protein [Salipaludibacillus sp. CUR1]MCE7792635.1 hypothetical protein [Salipaludibacillus sp. CUR1]